MWPSCGWSLFGSFVPPLPEIAIFSTKYVILNEAYTDEGRIKSYTMICPPVREIIHSLKLADYLIDQADKPWYNSHKSAYVCKYVRNSVIYFRMDIRPLSISSVWWFLMVISECDAHTVTTATKSSSSGSLVNLHAEQPACESHGLTLICHVPALDDSIDFRNYTGNISWLELFCDKKRYSPSRLLDGMFAPLGQTLKYIYIYDCFIINISRQVFGGLERLQRLRIRGGSYPQMDNSWLEIPTVSNSTQPSQTNLALPSITWYHDNLVLPEGVFSELHNLKSLGLTAMRLNSSVWHAVKHLRKLNSLNLSNNNITIIDINTINNLQNLRSLNLNDNHIQVIPNGTFESLSLLRFLYLSSNSIRTIAKGIFSGLSQLDILDLSVNKISIVEPDTFEGLSNLIYLYLAENRVRILSHLALSRLTSLRTLDLSCNLIEKIPKFSRSLTSMNLRNNSILEVDKSSFAGLQHLIHLDLSHNKISEYAQYHIPFTINEWNVSSNELSAASLNLTAKLVFADFRNNKLKTLTIYNLRDNRYARDSGYIYLAGNGDPFRCTCHTEMLNNKSTFIYDKSTVAQYHSWNFTSLNCMSVSESARESEITDISTRKFVCNTTCYGYCTCYYWKYGGDNVNIVDCLGAGLTVVPINISISCTILDLSGNIFPSLGPDNFHSLSQLMELYLNSSNITEIKKGVFRELSYLRKLDLSNNGISILNSGIFIGLSRLLSLDLSLNSLHVVVEGTFKDFDRLNNLDLAENKLENISKSDIESMHGIKSLQLSKNPWSCDCEFLETFKPFTTKNAKHIKDYTEIKCFDSNKTKHYLLEIDLAIICPDSEQKDAKSKPEIVLGSIFGVFVLGTFCFFILIKNREFFKLWLFIKFGWKSASAETEDWNRPYDAFLSYSNADEEFVTRELMPRLEAPRQGRLGYKLCVHFRDFPVGGHIPETILGAVNNSRRVIMILSDNFLSSDWCNYEFQAAHHQLLTEWQNRIIMVLLHDLNRSLLDRQLKLYLSTRTYVKVGDPLLWDKIEYAMPERKSPTEDNLNADNNDDQVDNNPAGGDEDTDEDVQLIN